MRELIHMTVQDEATAQGVILTSAAAAKVSNLLAAEGRDDLRLRIAVQPGGCSGLRYQLYFDEREIDGDIDAVFDGVHVVTDKMSAPYLTGATIDFVDTIEKQGFTIDNPNATGSCACGDSFHYSWPRPPLPPCHAWWMPVPAAVTDPAGWPLWPPTVRPGAPMA